MIVLDNLRFDVGRDGGSRQFPTAEVNGEMRVPHGCDWFSIREAGIKPNATGTRPVVCSGAGSYGQRKRTYGDPPLHLSSSRGFGSLPKTGMDRDWRRSNRPVFTPMKPGGKYGPTATQNESQERNNRSGALQQRPCWSRCQPHAPNRQDCPRSKCSGQCPRYADADTTVWKVEPSIGVQTS
jgi:hypothetical protein